MMKFINTHISVSRFAADAVAKKNGGRLPTHSELDNHVIAGNYGLFWAKELAVSHMLIEKGKDLTSNGIRIPYCEIEKADKQLIQSGKKGIVGVNDVFFLIDPEAFTFNGYYVVENPKITVVENAVLEFHGKGVADPETKIAVYAPETVLNSLPIEQIRWNMLDGGIRAIVRVGVGSVDQRIIKKYKINHCTTDIAKIDSTAVIYAILYESPYRVFCTGLECHTVLTVRPEMNEENQVSYSYRPNWAKE